jgi:amidase
VLSRTVRDTATALDCLNRVFPGDPYHAFAPPTLQGGYADLVSMAPKALRIGYVAKAPRDLENHPDVTCSIDAMASTLEALGHEVELTNLALLDEIEPTLTYVRIVAANVARSLDRVGDQIGSPLGCEDVEPLTWALAERGREIPVVQHLADIEFIHRFGREMARFQTEQDLDLLLTATQLRPPARIGEITSTPDEPLRAFVRAGPYGAFTLPFNLTGQPGISLPAGFTTGEDPGFPAGLPIGAQLVAPIGREDLLLQVAGQVERERNWAAQRPPIFG